jgi:hypothetical protein
MKKWIIFIVFSISLATASAQNLEFSKPEKLGTEINSEDEELAPMLSPDGNTLYFARAFHGKNMGGKYAGTDIWISRKDSNGNWTPAVNAGKPWNNKRSNAVIGISRDGATVYLSNSYNNKSGIASSTFINGRWSKPAFIPVPGINRDDFVGIYIHPDFDVMVISMKGKDTYGEEDLYVSLKDSLGNWSQPQNLGPTINTKGFEISPFLSPDRKKLYFGSNSHSGFGSADVFSCNRLYDSWQTWSVPRNLGPMVNSTDFDAYFCYSENVLASLASGVSLKLELKLVEVKQSKVITGNQVILTAIEIEQLFGKNAFFRFEFQSDSVELEPAQQEMLWYLTSKLVSVPNHSVELKIMEEHRPDLTNIRIKSMTDLMRSAGFEGSRFIFTENQKLIKVSNKTVIELVVIRESEGY